VVNAANISAIALGGAMSAPAGERQHGADPAPPLGI